MPAHADVLFVTAQSPDVSFRAALDKQGLRLLSVGLPRQQSFSSVLSGLGVTGAASVGDILTASGTTAIYVPAVQGASSGAVWEGFVPFSTPRGRTAVRSARGEQRFWASSSGGTALLVWLPCVLHV